MFSVRISGQDVRTLGVGGHGPVTVEYGKHGSEACSWEMSPNRTHPLIKANALVDVYHSGFRVWVGTLVEPSGDGQMSARGLWHEAERLYPMDAAYNITTIIDTAIIASVNTRGELHWGLPVSISGTPWASSGSPEDLTLPQLLDGHAAEYAMNWWISPVNRGLYMTALPTTPQWLIPRAYRGRGLTPADDEFFTRLDGRYLDAGSVYRTEPVASAEAAAAFGHRPKQVDLSKLGPTTAARANAVLTGMMLKSGARMGWGEGIEVGYGQITTPGGTPAALSQISSLQMVRISGTVDSSKPRLMRGYTDVVLETVKYTDGAKTIVGTPFGYAARSFEDVWEEALTKATR